MRPRRLQWLYRANVQLLCLSILLRALRLLRILEESYIDLRIEGSLVAVEQSITGLQGRRAVLRGYHIIDEGHRYRQFHRTHRRCWLVVFIRRRFFWYRHMSVDSALCFRTALGFGSAFGLESRE